MESSVKVLQRRCYEFLNTKWGMTLLILGGFWMIHGIFSVMQTVVQGGKVATPSCLHCCNNNYGDNLLETTFEERLCLPTVDVVYTWVNGSDDRLQESVHLWRHKLGIEHEDSHQEYDHGSNNTNTTKKQTRDQTSKARFRDNEELRYSMRSLWKNTPWVRHVYVVTNGQVPRWLNIDHPRLSLITHDQIFSNLSHLPTFSSPAIESHLHRIPGIAQYMLYLNDDVMFGNKVWPDDFYTRSKGQKVYLSWEVPPCSAGCPEAWVGDKYCDIACNVSACNFDGGDCLNGTDRRYNSWHGARRGWDSQRFRNTAARYCSYGCPNNWVGDKVCDRACKNKECGFDGGDCGIELIREGLYGVSLTPDTKLVELPKGTHAFWMNLSGAFSDKMTDASHDNPGFFRTAVITQKLHILTILLYTDLDADSKPVVPQVEVYLAGLHHGNSTSMTFNVTMPIERPNATAATPNATSATDAFGRTVPLGRSTATSKPTAGEVKAGAGTERMERKKGKEKGHKQHEGGASSSGAAASASAFMSGRRLLSDLAASVHVEAVPDSVDMSRAVARRLLSTEDRRLAEFIAVAKAKELEHLYRQELARAVERVRSRELADKRSRGEPAVVWPWELDPREIAWEASARWRPVTGRRLLDTFGDSLRYVNAIYNEHFGKEARKVPAHMPHLINTKVMEELQATWPDKFAATSAHKFRHPQDMQFSFSYFYFLMHQRREFDLKSEFDNALDLDGDGELNREELRYLALFLTARGTPKESDVDELTVLLKNATLNHMKPVAGFDPGSVPRTFKTLLKASIPITAFALQHFEIVRSRLAKTVRNVRKYPFETTGQEDIEFYMVGDNFTKVRDHLYHVRRKQPKFICLNDNMGGSPDPRLPATLQEFFHSYYPRPCPFELSPSDYHQHGYLADILSDRASHRRMRLILFGVLSVVVAGTLYVFFPGCRWGGRRVVSSTNIVMV